MPQAEAEGLWGSKPPTIGARAVMSLIYLKLPIVNNIDIVPGNKIVLLRQTR